MWAYRVKGVYHNCEFTRSLAQISKIIEISDCPMDNINTVKMAWKQAEALWRTIGWDGSISGEARCFFTPGAAGFAFGFTVISADQVTFIASPYPCDWLKDVLDWDAYTDSEEISRARQAIVFGEMPRVPERIMLKWSRSSKGNLFTVHGNAVITVFYDNRNQGYKAVVSFGNLKTFTPVQNTEPEACEYVVKHFDRLKRELTPQPLNPDDPWNDG